MGGGFGFVLVYNKKGEFFQGLPFVNKSAFCLIFSTITC